MDRRHVLLTGGTVAAGALAGCLGSAQSQSDDPPESDSNESERTITVSKSGTAAAEPDLAIVQVAVEASGSDAQGVRNDLATRSADLENALIEFGLDEDDITTARYDINERRDEPVARSEPETDTDAAEDDGGDVRYEGVHAFTVEVADVDEIGEVIDTAVDAGADSVNRAEYTLSDEMQEELREDALEDAMGNARSEANLLAGEADSSISDVRAVETSDATVRPVSGDAVMMESANGNGGGTELAADDVTVTAQVSITYDIE